MRADEYCASAEAIQATIDIDADTLNLKSKGKWITAYIEFPEGYDVLDIEVSEILLNSSISAEEKPASIGDYDNDGILDLMVKFDRQDLIDLLKNIGIKDKDIVKLTVVGNLLDGISFEGSDTITVNSRGNN